MPATSDRRHPLHVAHRVPHRDIVPPPDRRAAPPPRRSRTTRSRSSAPRTSDQSPAPSPDASDRNSSPDSGCSPASTRCSARSPTRPFRPRSIGPRADPLPRRLSLAQVVVLHAASRRSSRDRRDGPPVAGSSSPGRSRACRSRARPSSRRTRRRGQASILMQVRARLLVRWKRRHLGLLCAATRRRRFANRGSTRRDNMRGSATSARAPCDERRRRAGRADLRKRWLGREYVVCPSRCAVPHAGGRSVLSR